MPDRRWRKQGSGGLSTILKELPGVTAFEPPDFETAMPAYVAGRGHCDGADLTHFPIGAS